MSDQGWPRTFWPGAVCDDWFGVFAFYTTLAALSALAVLLVYLVGWLICKQWRMRYRNEGWWE